MTSQHEANEAIKSALVSLDVESDLSDSEQSDSEDTASHKTAATEVGSLPADDHRPFSGNNNSNTSVAREVATGNVSFGKFATQWLSRQSWPIAKPAADHTQTEVDDTKSQTGQEPASKQDVTSAAESGSESLASSGRKPQQIVGVATIGLLPRILKTTKMIFTSRSYFFSYDLDLTRRLEKLGRLDQSLAFRNLDPLVCSFGTYIPHH